ncbi:MAG: ABC transporter permease, partial [Alphaproteobacteria bacterium]
MPRYLIRRLAGALLVLAVMSFVIFFLIALMPGDPIDIMIASNPDLTPADAVRLRALHGLDVPIWQRYINWLTAALGGDFGYSRNFNRPVFEVLMPRLGNTIILLGLSSI